MRGFVIFLLVIAVMASFSFVAANISTDKKETKQETKEFEFNTFTSAVCDNSQDFVLLANILFQSSKKTDIFKEAGRVLKKGGTMIVIDWKKGTGGFGPPEGRRTDEVEMTSLVDKKDFVFKNKLDAGQFHYGLVFTKE